MTKFILGTKQNMTQVFDENGRVHPATVIVAGPVKVTQVKTTSGKDGYNAVQVGFGKRAEKNINKPLKGHMKDGNFKYLREFSAEGMNIGDTIDLSTFAPGDKVTVSAVSKGK